MADLIVVTLLTILAATGYAPVAVPAAMLLLCVYPGRLISGLTGIGRGWDRWGRLVVAVAMSLAFVPVALYPLWCVGHSRRLFLAVIWAVLIGASVLRIRRERRGETGMPAWVPGRPFCEHRATAALMLLVALVIVVATVGPYWPASLHGCPLPAGIHDFVKHHAVMYELAQRPLPLGNPFYAGEATGPVYYYHFFYLVPATIRVIAPSIGIQLAFGLHSALVGLVTAFCVYLIARRFAGAEGPAVLSLILTSLVGGLDVLPALVFRMRLVVTLDAWADHVVRIHNLLFQMMWSPQNMLGVLVVLVVVYALSEKGDWRGWLLLGPAAGLAAWGASPWPAMVLFAGFGGWWMVDALVPPDYRRRSRQRLAVVAAVGGLAAIAATPVLMGYAVMSHRHGKGLTFIWPYQWYAWLGKLVPPGPLANLLDLPWVLALELGPLLLIPILLVPRTAWKRAWRDDGLRFLLVSAALAVVGYVTVRSHFQYNDFGQKTMMIVEVAGAIMASMAIRPERLRSTLVNPFGWDLHAGTGGKRKWVTAFFVAMLVLGSPISWSEVPLTVARRFLSPSGVIARIVPAKVRRAETEGPVWEWMRQNLSSAAVVQSDPGEDRSALLQVIERQLGITVLDEDTMVFHPAGMAAYEQRLADVRAALDAPTSAERLRDVLLHCGVTHVFVGTVERSKWKCLDALEDAKWFVPLIREPGGSVYELVNNKDAL